MRKGSGAGLPGEGFTVVFLGEESNLVSEEQEESLGISKYEYERLQCMRIHVSARGLKEK